MQSLLALTIIGSILSSTYRDKRPHASVIRHKLKYIDPDLNIRENYKKFRRSRRPIERMLTKSNPSTDSKGKPKVPDVVSSKSKNTASQKSVKKTSEQSTKTPKVPSQKSGSKKSSPKSTQKSGESDRDEDLVESSQSKKRTASGKTIEQSERTVKSVEQETQSPKLESESKAQKSVKSGSAQTDKKSKSQVTGSTLQDDFTNTSQDSKKSGKKSGEQSGDSESPKDSQASNSGSLKDDFTNTSQEEESQSQKSGGSDQSGDEEEEEEFSAWSNEAVGTHNRFEDYDEEKQEYMRGLLKRIVQVYEEAREKVEIVPEDLEVTLKDENYIEFRLPGFKYYLMHMTLEYKDYSNKYYAIMNSDDFVDLSRSVLYISEKRLEDQVDHLAGHLESFIEFFYEHVNNRREFEELEDRFEQRFKQVFESREQFLRKTVDTPNYKMMEVSLKGEVLRTGEQMYNIMRLYVYKLDSKHFMIDLKGEVREMSMIVKIFLSDEELESVIDKVVRTAQDNNDHEFAWVSVPLMINMVLNELKAMENNDEQGGDYLQIEESGENQEFSVANNTIQYEVKHVPGEDEDPDEEIIMKLNFFLYKDEFLPSIYFNVDSTVYESEYLVPFSGQSAEFSEMMLSSVIKAYKTIKQIIYELADIDEQDVFEYTHDEVVDMIKEGVAQEDMCETDDIKVVQELDTEYDGVPFLEEKIFHDPRKYFTVHNIEMEEERNGYLVNCYNLQTVKGDVGEYRIYAKNYYDCKEDFFEFIRGCMNG